MPPSKMLVSWSPSSELNAVRIATGKVIYTYSWNTFHEPLLPTVYQVHIDYGVLCLPGPTMRFACALN